jgi:hypothetical protein
MIVAFDQLVQQIFGPNGGLGNIFKGLGIGTLGVLVVYLLFKFQVIHIASVGEQTISARLAWAKAKYHRQLFPPGWVEAHWWSRAVKRPFQRFGKLLYLLGRVTGVNRCLRWIRSRRRVQTAELRVTAFVLSYMRRFEQSKHMQARRSRLGRMGLLGSGGHFVIKGLHGLIHISLREMPLAIPAKDMTFRRRTLTFLGTLTYRVAFEDSEQGDRNVYNYIWSVRDPDTHDQSKSIFEDKLLATVMEALNELRSVADADDEGFPVFTIAMLNLACGEKLLAKHGIVLTALEVPPLAWTGEQIRADAETAKARVMADAEIEKANILADAIRAQTPIGYLPDETLVPNNSRLSSLAIAAEG